MSATDEIFQSKGKQTTARDFQFVGQRFRLLKKGFLQRYCGLHIRHNVILSFLPNSITDKKGEQRWAVVNVLSFYQDWDFSRNLGIMSSLSHLV